MSSNILFIYKKEQNVYHCIITSGSLKYLYDPKIFMLNDDAINSFLQKATEKINVGQPTKELFEKIGQIIIMNFNNKRVIDCQQARGIRFLSSLCDVTWQHVDSWANLNWLGDGVFDPKNQEIVEPFLVGEHPITTLKRAIMKHGAFREEELIIAEDNCLPLIQIDPLGWSFTSFAEFKNYEDIEYFITQK